MLVTFKTKHFHDVVYLGDVGLAMLRGMGQSDRVPGILTCEDIPKALAALEEYIDKHPKDPAAKAGQDEEDKRKNVGLQTRALPLIEMLNFAHQNEYDVLWE